MASTDFEVCPCDHGHALAAALGIVWSAIDHNVCAMPTERYRFHVASVQDQLNANGLPAMFAWELRAALRRLVGPGPLLVQSELYLRAARPGDGGDVVGWHRESMYGGPPNAWNVWIPLCSIDERNALRYVPGSAAIPDREITVEPDAAMAVRGSAGHRIGLLYAPKRITGGVNLASSLPMLVPLGSAAVFPGALVHGAGANNGDAPRVSVDMRVIAQRGLC